MNETKFYRTNLRKLVISSFSRDKLREIHGKFFRKRKETFYSHSNTNLIRMDSRDQHFDQFFVTNSHRLKSFEDRSNQIHEQGWVIFITQLDMVVIKKEIKVSS